MNTSLTRWPLAIAMLLVALQFPACSKQPAPANQPAKPTESKDRTYRTLDGHRVLAILSSDELEIRTPGENIVCKYTEKDNTLRVVVTVMGTTRAHYFNITPDGLVDEDGVILYDPATYQKKTLAIKSFNSGLQAVNEGDYKKAIDDFSEAIRLDPQSGSYSNRGVAYARSGNLTKAFADYNDAIRLNPSNALAYLSRGIAYFEMGDYDKAFADGIDAIMESPNNAECYNTLAWWRAVCPDKTYRNGDKAVEYAKKACEISEWKIWYHVGTLAASYAEVGNFDEAIKWQRKALEMSDKDPKQTLDGEKERLSLYEHKQPYREPKKKSSVAGIPKPATAGTKTQPGHAKPQDLIIGTWTWTGALEGIVLNKFTRNGVVKVVGQRGIPFEAKYRFVDDNHIEYLIGTQKQYSKIENITNDKLVVIDEQGRRTEWTRP